MSVVFVGPLPPPIHGMAAVNAEMLRLLRARGTVWTAAVQPDVQEKGTRYHLSKAMRAIGALATILRARLRGATTLYGSVDDGYGGIWTTLFVCFGRLLGLRIFLHHHSYRYIAHRKLLVALLVSAAGAKARHILLCEGMGRQFRQAYPKSGPTLAVPNAVAVAGETVPARAEGRTRFTIGLLSNLTFEKGLAEFVAILEKAAEQGDEIDGILAGPVIGVEVENFIRAKQRSLGARLSWIGPVSGQAKQAFFETIDLFVFPSRSEAYPLVLVESMVGGVPVVAAARGCITELSGLAGAYIVAPGEDFVDHALGLARALGREPEVLRTISERARAEAMALNRQNRDRAVQLADAIMHAQTPGSRE